MTAEQQMIRQIVREADHAVDLSRLANAAFRFAIEVVRLIRDVSHPIVGEAIDAAHAADAANDEGRMDTTRIRCWETLSREFPGLDTPAPAVSGIRAAILMLEMKESVMEGEFLEALDYLLEWVNDVRDHVNDELRLARAHFECLLQEPRRNQ